MPIRFRGDRERSAGIVIHDNHILLMRRRKKDKPEYFSIPGGGIESEEDATDAVVREILEETTVVVECQQLAYHYIYSDINSQSFYYMCRYVSGEPQLDPASEEALCMTDGNQFHPMWVSLDDLPDLRLYPIEVRDKIIKHAATGFPDTTERVAMQSADIRQDP